MDPATISRPYSDKWAGHVILTFAVGPNHPQRLTRLATMVAITREATAAAVGPWVDCQARGLITVEYTALDEQKGLRGIMRLAEKVVEPTGRKKLLYVSPLDERGVVAAFRMWLEKETQWQQSKAKNEALRNRLKVQTTPPNPPHPPLTPA